MSKTEKIPATKLSGLLYGISLILIISPSFILLLGSRLMPAVATSQLQMLCLVPFPAGIALYLLLRWKKII
jgi:hypothetical protein